MPHVSVHYTIILPAGHHRQPRNANSQLEPNNPIEVDVDNPGNISPLYIPQLPFGNNQLAQMLFWSVTDGSNGKTYPAGPLTQSVGGSPLVITAWYYPIGGGGNGGGTAIIDDAFSAAKGDFIDDTFVTVTSDPSLTNDANVVGVVPTTRAQTLKAAHSVNSTSEPFSKWMSFGAGTPSSDTLNVPTAAVGLAIAVYEKSQVDLTLPHRDDAIGGTLIGGVAFDGGGYILVGGKPHPVDPWGPLVISLVQASLASAGSRSMSRKFGAEVRQLAAKSVVQEIKEALPQIEKAAEGKV